MLTFEKFRESVEESMFIGSPWRVGQHAFNMLRQHRPDISEVVRGDAAIDPFYRDERLPAFWAFVEARW